MKATVDTTRRAVILAGALASAACAISLAAAATGHRPACPAVDPIHAAIEAHREAVARADYESARLSAAGGSDLVDWRPAHEAHLAAIDSGRALIAIVPVSMAGLRALEAHLRDPRYSRATRFIERRVEFGDGIASVSGGPEAVDWVVRTARERCRQSNRGPGAVYTRLSI
jgi:hypothetical protein